MNTPAPTAPATPAAASVVDLHYHAGPDLYRRRYTCYEAGARYANIGGWVVLKSHLVSTAAQAWEARRAGLPVSGSVVLNDLSGGIRPQTLEQAVYAHGADSPVRLVAYLPTLAGSAHPSRLVREPFHPLLDPTRRPGPRVVDEDGRLRPGVREVLRAAKDLPIVLATGHCDRQETERVIDEAVRLGLPRLLLTHATHPMSGWTPKELSGLRDVPGLYVELTALTVLLGHRDLTHVGEVAVAHPNVVYSSDLGQPDQPPPAAWLRLSRSWFARAGLGPQQVRAITRDNPARVLAL